MIKLEGEFMKEYNSGGNQAGSKRIASDTERVCRICQLLQTDGRALGKERRGNPGTNCSVVKNVAEISGI